MNLEAQLNSLQERLTAALRQLPGATAIYIYGSRATCRTDGYADLDLQVYIHGRVMCAVWPQFLERVGPVETAWPLNGAADNTTFTIFFSHESYYHKVDIGLSEDAAVPTSTETGVLLWSQAPAPAVAVCPGRPVYSPAYGSVAHQALAELIAAERYLRARKRGQNLLCWRFIRAMPDRMLTLLRDQRNVKQVYEQPLTTREIKTLESSLPAGERAQFISHLGWSEPAAMDANLLWFNGEIIRLLRARVVELNETYPEDIIARHRAFIRGELGL